MIHRLYTALFVSVCLVTGTIAEETSTIAEASTSTATATDTTGAIDTSRAADTVQPVQPVITYTRSKPKPKRRKRFLSEFVWGNDAFAFSSSPYTAVYDDGVDEYPIAIPQIEITRNNQFGMSLGWVPLQTRFFEEALLIGFQFITGDELSGVQFQLTGRNVFVVRRWLRLHLDIGGSYNSVNLVVGTVGTGNRSGADFMNGPHGQYIPEGAELFLNTGFFAAQAGGGLQVDIYPPFYLDVSGKYVFYCNSNKWVFMAAGKNDAVELPAGNFTDPERPGSVKNTGPGIRIAAGFRF